MLVLTDGPPAPNQMNLNLDPKRPNPCPQQDHNLVNQMKTLSLCYRPEEAFTSSLLCIDILLLSVRVWSKEVT